VEREKRGTGKMKLFIWERIWGIKDWNIIEEIENVDTVWADCEQNWGGIHGNAAVYLGRKEGDTNVAFRIITGNNIPRVYLKGEEGSIIYLTVLCPEKMKWYQIFSKARGRTLRFELKKDE